ncbi:MAG: SRPBCC family protein [Candidatus Dadabacteria bacterium]|nr:MAG: SRPBCC family protein [Candidatus Dadabacteria bacterium]
MARQASYVPCETFSMDYFDIAPVRFVYDREIPVSAETLFAIFRDADAWPKWAGGIRRVEWTSAEPFGVGTTRIVDLSGGLSVDELFIAWEEGRRMAFCLRGSTRPVWRAFGEDYQLTPLDDDRCRLRWIVAYEPRGWFATIHPLMGPVMKKSLGRFADELVRFAPRWSR